MPVFLVHGFKWDRKPIRVRIIVNDIEDASPEWLHSDSSQKAMLDDFRKHFPGIMVNLPELRFIEQYNAADLGPDAVSQPWAFVADKVVKSDYSIDVTDVMNKGIDTKSWEAMAELRDKIAPQANIGWFAVFNSDEERIKMQEQDDAGTSSDESGSEADAAVTFLAPIAF